MKLHLPKTLFTAVMAVMAVGVAHATITVDDSAQTVTISGTVNNNISPDSTDTGSTVSGTTVPTGYTLVFDTAASGSKGNYFANNAHTYNGAIQIGDGVDDDTTGMVLDNGNSGTRMVFTGTVTGSGTLAKTQGGSGMELTFAGDATGYTGNMTLGAGAAWTLRFGNGGAAAETSATAGASGTGSITFTTDNNTLAYNYAASEAPVYVTNAISASGSGSVKIQVAGNSKVAFTNLQALNELNGSGTAIIAQDLTLAAGLHTRNTCLGVGTADAAGTLTVGRLEMGDNDGGSSSLSIAEGSLVKVTGTSDVRNNYKTTSLIFSEWNNDTAVTVNGTLLAAGATAYTGDRKTTYNIEDGGVMAVKGIGYNNTSKDNQANIINLKDGGLLVLGANGIETPTADSKFSSSLQHGTIGISADATLGATLNLASADGTTFDTSLYTFTDTGVERSAQGGTMTVTGTIGTGKMIIDGNGTLALNGTFAHTGGTEVLSGATLSLSSASTLGGTITNGGTVSFAEGTTLNIGAPANYTGNVTFIDTEGTETAQGNGFANIGSLTIIDGGTITGSAVVRMNGQDIELSAATNGTVAVNDTDYTTYYLKSGSAVLSDIKGANEAAADAHVDMLAGTTLTVDSGTMTGTMTVSADTVYTQPEAGIAGTYNKDVTIADLGGSGSLTVTGGSTMTLAGGTAADVNIAMSNGKLVVTSDTTIGNITAPGNANGITVNEGAKLTANNIDPAWSLGDVTINGELDVTNLKLHTGAVNKSFNGAGTLKVGSALFTNWTQYTFRVNTMEFGSMSVSNGSDITIGGGTASIEGALTVAGGSQLTVSGGTLNLGTSSTVNGTMSTTGGRVVTGEAGLTVANGGTLSINRISGNDGSQGAIQGSLTVQNGGTVKLAQGDVLGYSGGATSTQKLKVENGGTVKLMHANNETFTGALVLNGTITTEVANNADAVGTWDLYRGNASVSVDAGEHGVFDKTKLRIRRDNATFTVGEGGSLTTGNIILGASESNGHIIKAGSGDMIVGGTAAITGLQVTGGSIDFQAGTVALNTLNVAADTTASFVSLTLNNNASLDIAGAVSLSDTLSLGTGITLGDSLTTALANLTAGNSLTLFSGATTFNVNGSAFVAGTTASTVFNGIASDNYLLSFTDNTVSITLAPTSNDIIIDSASDNQVITGGTFTNIIGESAHSVKLDGDFTITESISMAPTAVATLTPETTVNNKGVIISGTSVESTLSGSETDAAFQVNNAAVAVDTVAEGETATLEGALVNSSVTNESGAELIVSGGDSSVTKMDILNGSEINFTNVTDQVMVQELTLSADAVVGVFDGELKAIEKGLTVTETLIVDGDSTMNANLTVAQGVSMYFNGTLTMGSTVNIAEGTDIYLSESLTKQFNDGIILIDSIDAESDINQLIGHNIYGVVFNEVGEAVRDLSGNLTYEFLTTTLAGTNSDGTHFMATPEPATATLSLLALAGLMARRRRH